MNPQRLSFTQKLVRRMSFATPNFPTKLRWLHLVFQRDLNSEWIYELPLLGTRQTLMRVSPSTVLGSEILLFGLFEKDYAAMFSRIIRPGDVVLDIGANIGQYTLMAAEKVGPGGLVLSIEPATHIFERLEAHVQLNGYVNVKALKCAAGEANREGKLALVRDKNDGMHHLDDGVGQGPMESVSIRLLDDILHQILPEGREVDVVKIDVEGWEEAVFKGAERMLAQTNPPTIFFESIEEHAKPFGFSAKRLRETFARRGYRVFVLGDHSSRWRSADQLNDETFSNAVAVFPTRKEHLQFFL